VKSNHKQKLLLLNNIVIITKVVSFMDMNLFFVAVGELPCFTVARYRSCVYLFFRLAGKQFIGWLGAGSAG